MVDEMPRFETGDERDDLAALETGIPDDAEGSILDAFDIYGQDQPGEADTPTSVVTVTNPPGTVSVTTLLDGRVSRIELSSKAGELTEAELAAEIVVIAGLATADAKSRQYARMLDGMRDQGHDDAATRDFLNRDLDLPSPEQAQAERARVFATRYAGEHD